MLQLTRGESDKVVLQTSDGPVFLEVKRLTRSNVRLNLQLPDEIKVFRYEVLACVYSLGETFLVDPRESEVIFYEGKNPLHKKIAYMTIDGGFKRGEIYTIDQVSTYTEEQWTLKNENS